MLILSENNRKDSFIAILLTHLTPEIEKAFRNPEEKRLLNENLMRELRGEVRQSAPESESKPEIEFLREVQRRYSEFATSLERMRAIAIFIRQYPNYQIYKKYNITHTFYLRYHVENYFNEIFLFKERVNMW